MFYRFARALLIFIFTLFFRWDVQGRENLPHEGAYMLCANHFSWWDPPAVGAIPKRFVKFMAKEELLKMPLTGKILSTGCFSGKTWCGQAGAKNCTANPWPQEVC